MIGSGAMQKRPMHELLNCLENLGCRIEYQEEKDVSLSSYTPMD